MSPVRHTLVLLRHAKSAWPHGVPDHERPLAGKGRRNAKATGEWFAAEGPRVDLVLCSDAVRALHTWEIARASLDRKPRTRTEPRVYGADERDLLRLVQATPESVRTLLVVGHEPTMSGTARLLAGRGSDRTALERMARKYPTNGIAVLETDGTWAALGPRGALLRTFAVPRA